MRQRHLHLCLFQPEIPQNTGSIARLAAATQCRLHLVKPFGFDTDDRNLRRPGLDYWPFLDLEIHEGIDELLQLFPPERIAFFSKKAQKPYTSMPADVDLLVFGPETRGLPDSLLSRHAERCYHIPMFHAGVRSLNLANAAAIVLYHQLWNRGLIPPRAR